MEDEVKVKSLLKAIQVLECFTPARPELGITEISEMLDLYKSNVHNILTTFMAKGYIERNPDNEKYRLGTKILELSWAVNANLNLKTIALPHMQAVADKMNETIYFGIPSNEGEVIYLESCSPSTLAARTVTGIKAPMYCTGIGKAMLAFLPEDKQDKFTSGNLQKYTDNTITSRVKLLTELQDIRVKGFSIDNMEHEYGIKCVGVPILDRFGRVVGGISLSGPSLRFTENRIVEMVVALKGIAAFLREKI